MSAGVAHPVNQFVRRPPQGLESLFNEMKSFKSSMVLLIDQVSQLRAENSALSLDVRMLMQNLDYNFNEIRQELADLKSTPAPESWHMNAEPSDNGDLVMQSQPMFGVDPSAQRWTTVSPDADALSSSDVVDLATIMGNGSVTVQMQPATTLPKEEIVNSGSREVSVKEEVDYTNDGVTDFLFLQPCTSVASTSSEVLTGEDLQGQRKRSFELDDDERIRLAEKQKKEREAEDLLKRGFYCMLCRRRCSGPRCVIPHDPNKLEIFVKSAAKTMVEDEIEWMLKNRKKSSTICETHVPGFREELKKLIASQYTISLAMAGKLGFPPELLGTGSINK